MLWSQLGNILPLSSKPTFITSALMGCTLRTFFLCNELHIRFVTRGSGRDNVGRRSFPSWFRSFPLFLSILAPSPQSEASAPATHPEYAVPLKVPAPPQPATTCSGTPSETTITLPRQEGDSYYPDCLWAPALKRCVFCFPSSCGPVLAQAAQRTIPTSEAADMSSFPARWPSVLARRLPLKLYFSGMLFLSPRVFFRLFTFLIMPMS